MERLRAAIQIRRYLTIVFVLLLVLSFPRLHDAKSPKWFERFIQVVPLVSTRIDVESLFRSPKVARAADGSSNEKIQYTIKEGRLSVFYSKGDCSLGGTYNVGKGVVTSITAYLDKPVSWSVLRLDIKTFDKREVSDLPGNFTFVNERTGMWLFGSESEVHEITLRPALDKSHMECPGAD